MLITEATRPEGLWEPFRGRPPSAEAIEAGKFWLDDRGIHWQTGAILRRGSGAGGPVLVRYQSPPVPGQAETAMLFKRYASTVPSIAFHWGREFHDISRKESRYPRRFPLFLMLEAAQCLNAMRRRFPDMKTGAEGQPLMAENLPVWTTVHIELWCPLY